MRDSLIRILILVSLTLTAGLLVACDEGTDPAVEAEEQGDLLILGEYADNWGSYHSVTAATWTTGYAPNAAVFHIETYSNDAEYLIAENDADNAFAAGLWSRFDWTEDGGDLYYCQTAFDAASAADAETTEPADDGDLVEGCGGFGWTQLIAGGLPDLAIVGNYTDDFGDSHAISSDQWLQSFSSGDTLTFAIELYDNHEQFIVAENGDDDLYNAGLFSRFDWTWDADSILYYCQSAFDAETADDAEATARPDDSDPASAGCGVSSFAWTSLTAAQ